MTESKTTRLTDNANIQIIDIIEFRKENNYLVVAKKNIIAELIAKEHKRVIKK